MDTFDEYKLITVTPGRLAKYINDGTGSVSIHPGRNLFAFSKGNGIPARFKMCLRQVKFSKSCLQFLKKQFKGDIFITLRWISFNFEDFVTAPEKVEDFKSKFDFTIKYQIQVDSDFLTQVSDKPIIFKLYAVCEGTELLLSEGQFFIDDIVAVANVKQQQRVRFSSNLIDKSGDMIAFLDMWYKFTCKQKTLRELFPASKPKRKSKTSARVSDLLGNKFARKSQSFGNVHVTDSEFDHFADSVLLVLNRNKVLKTTQSDINNELQERVRWLRFEANWKQTLQENAILHGKSPEDVIWRQWREEDTANVRLRTYDDIKPTNYPPELSVTVMSLYFLGGCPLLRNDEIKQFYIEYSFLGYEGPTMESPFSVAKAEAEEKIIFNFKKTFPIDLHKNISNCKKLTELIKNDDMIRFVVISEPLENKNRPIQTCSEVGYAEVTFNELIQLQDNEDTYEYEVIDINNSIAVLGYLTVKIEGILAMRKMALDFMAPQKYKLYM